MKTVTDHKGNIYPSIAAVCKAYNISRSVYKSRLEHGWSMEAALTTPVVESKSRRHTKPATDHKGVEYPSITAMCKAYGISAGLYNARRRIGWTVEEALTTPVGEGANRGKPVTDHKGVEYPTLKEMCAAYGITPGAFNVRRSNGWSVERALTTPVVDRRDGVTDHKGNRYDSVTAMCSAYNVPLSVYFNRILRGWSVEEALTGGRKTK